MAVDKEKNDYRAIARRLPISPSKVAPIARLIRNKNYVKALALVDSLPNKGALFLSKLLKSAAANALDINRNLDEESLFIKELIVNEGPRYKRIWPRGRGRADRQLKRYSHISVVLAEKLEVR